MECSSDSLNLVNVGRGVRRRVGVEICSVGVCVAVVVWVDGGDIQDGVIASVITPRFEKS